MGVIRNIHTCAAAGAAFLLAVLWFDLMFDVQCRKHAGNPLPADLLASISAYYRRVTTDAYPMNRLVALVMLLTIAAIVAEIVIGVHAWWIGWVSLILVGSGVVIIRERNSSGLFAFRWSRAPATTSRETASWPFRRLLLLRGVIMTQGHGLERLHARTPGQCPPRRTAGTGPLGGKSRWGHHRC